MASSGVWTLKKAKLETDRQPDSINFVRSIDFRLMGSYSENFVLLTRK